MHQFVAFSNFNCRIMLCHCFTYFPNSTLLPLHAAEMFSENCTVSYTQSWQIPTSLHSTLNWTITCVNRTFHARQIATATGILDSFLVWNQRPGSICLHHRQASLPSNCSAPLAKSTLIVAITCSKRTPKNCSFYRIIFDCLITITEHQ